MPNRRPKTQNPDPLNNLLNSLKALNPEPLDPDPKPP